MSSSILWLRLTLVLAAIVLAISEDGGRLAEKEAKVAAARAELRRAEAELAEVRAEGAAAGGRLRSSAVAVSTCNARIWAQDHVAAAAYLAKQHRLRAPYYIRSARRSFEAGLRQLKGEDKSNNDPYIKQYEGFNQLVGALELAPDDAQIWLDAGKVTVALASLADDKAAEHHALSFMARACTLDPTTLPLLADWFAKTKKDVRKEEKQIRKALWRQVKQWNSTGTVPDLPVQAIPSITDGSCALSAAPSSATDGSVSKDEVDKAIRGFQLRNLFPTKVLSVNVLKYMPEGFAQRLSDICVQKYAEFGEKFPGMDPNDLNDKFFGYQVTGESELKSPKAQKRWPEMYTDSRDFKLLLRLMRGALRNFAKQTGVPDLPDDKGSYGVVLWAAVYPGNGGRHGYHVHQGSLSSCVIYLRTAGATTPITFVDPRGAPPVNDYEQYLKERDFEPVAPFHHSEYFFPEAGDLVCFPSWLVHNVPSHWETATRVAFAANLQGNDGWDSWHRTAAGWS